MSATLTLPPPPTELRGRQMHMPRPPSNNAQTRLLATRPLAYHLGSIGIKPYDPRAVHAYQAKQLSKFYHPEQPRRTWQSYLMTACPVIFFFSDSLVTNWPHYWVVVTWTLIGALISTVAWIVTKPTPVSPNPWVRWEEVPLEYFHGQVPPEALEVVEEVKTRLPKAVGIVEYLEHDPILWIEHRNIQTGTHERFAVHVWGEPEFTG